MTDHIVIHGELSGDWCLVFDPARNDYARLFKPGDWSAPYRSLGLRYHPHAGINLSRHPRRAHRQAKRIIADKERALKWKTQRTLRRREAIAKIKEQRMTTTPTGIPVRDCGTCGRRHPITREHCPVCGHASLFCHQEARA